MAHNDGENGIPSYVLELDPIRDREAWQRAELYEMARLRDLCEEERRKHREWLASPERMEAERQYNIARHEEAFLRLGEREQDERAAPGDDDGATGA